MDFTIDKDKLFDENLKIEFSLKHSELYGSINVSCYRRITMNCSHYNADEISIPGFEKSQFRSFGFGLWGYIFYFTDKKYDKEEFIEGIQRQTTDILINEKIGVFLQLNFRLRRNFNSKNYNDANEMQKDIENWMQVCRMRYIDFARNYNQIMKEKYGISLFSAKDVFLKLKKNQ